jgi:hypothetical protein
MTGSGVMHRFGAATADYANANPPYILIPGSIAKRCVSKDEVIELGIALEFEDVDASPRHRLQVGQRSTNRVAAAAMNHGKLRRNVWINRLD